jgi:hypothetical protein
MGQLRQHRDKPPVTPFPLQHSPSSFPMQSVTIIVPTYREAEDLPMGPKHDAVCHSSSPVMTAFTEKALYRVHHHKKLLMP